MIAGQPKFRVLALAGLVALASGVAITARSPLAAETKQIIVSVFDTNTSMTNATIMGLGLKGADFAIREDNVDREVVSAEPATGPISVVLLADTTSALGNFVNDERSATAGFIKEFLSKSPGSSVALWEFGGAAIPIVDFTSDVAKLEAAAGRLFPKGSYPDALKGHGVASNLLEGLLDAAKQLGKRPEARRAIFAFNSDLSGQASQLPGQQIQDEVVKANATVWALSIHNVEAANGPKRDDVLNKLCPLSGGKRIGIIDYAALEDKMKGVADIMTSQYVVTYTRPSGSPKQVRVLLKRNGLTATTAGWAPK